MQQFVQGVDPYMRAPAVGMVGLGVGPRTPFDPDGEQAGVRGGEDVVVEAVPDVGDLLGRLAGACDELVEEGGRELLCTPVVGGGDDVRGQVQLADELAGPRGLVAGDADAETALLEGGKAAADVGVEVAGVEVLAEPGFQPKPAFLGQVETRPEVLKGLAGGDSPRGS